MRKKQIPSYVIIVAVAGIVTAMALNDPVVYNPPMFLAGMDVSYTPSDITQANPNILAPDGGSASFKVEFVSDIRDSVSYTIHGTVRSVGSPVPWTGSAGNERGIIPVELQVIQASKGEAPASGLFTVHLLADKIYGKYYLDSYEPEFEVGEEVIVHISVDVLDKTSGELNLVTLGDYAKYQVNGDRAYNAQFPYGKPVDAAKNEAR